MMALAGTEQAICAGTLPCYNGKDITVLRGIDIYRTSHGTGQVQPINCVNH